MIISVASGKGGTGKTLVATSLALSLSGSYRVKLLDCDVEEPNDHIFMRPEFVESEVAVIPVPVIDENACTHCGLCADVCAYNALAVLKTTVMTFHELCHGCGACGYLCPEKAITEEPRAIGKIEKGRASGIEFAQGVLNVGEAMAPPVIRQVKKCVGGEDITIIDASPGTSCPVIEAVKGSDFCLLVTDPTPFGLNDLELAVDAIATLKIPRGVVINRSGDGDINVEKYCHSKGIPVMMKIPLDMDIARMYAKGVPLVTGKPEWKERFCALYEGIKQGVC
ncbi:MAG: ATP-binding protein [Dehalococcoidia bacterium]